MRKFIESAEEGIGPRIPPATVLNDASRFGELEARQVNGAKSKPFKGKMKHGWRKTTKMRFLFMGKRILVI